MPPKAKYTREEIAQIAFELIKREGVSALTARELGKCMGTSARPIFTAFVNMDDVKQAVRALAFEEFKEYISDFRDYTPAFKRIGMMMVSYGVHEPELFKLLFMQEHHGETGFQNVLNDLGEIADTCLELIIRDYGMTKEEASMLFEQMWTHAYGLGAMCANKVCSFTEEEIGRREGMMFAGQVMLIKSGRYNEVFAAAEKGASGEYRGRPVGDLPYREE